MTSGPVDWQHLMTLAGVPDGHGSSHAARRAISALLPAEVIRDAVDTYVARRPGSELARSVLWHIKPAAAGDRCLEIYHSDAPIGDRRSAVEPFRVVAVAEHLPLIHDFLHDSDPEIQAWGMWAVTQMIIDGEVDEESAREFLDAGTTHPNPHVRRAAAEFAVRRSRRRRLRGLGVYRMAATAQTRRPR